MVGVSPANAGHFVLFLTTIALVICHEDTRHKSKGLSDLESSWLSIMHPEYSALPV
jgi:hypothetical protein